MISKHSTTALASAQPPASLARLVGIGTQMIRPAALTLALALAGCAANPPMAKLDLPASANASLPAGIDAWWRSLNDATLSQLIDEALAHNADVLLAAERIGQSQAVLDETRINLLPDANLSSSANRRKPSEETTAKGQSGASTSYKTGIGVSYEIDLWGRLSLARDAARAQLAASGYAREVSRSAVAAQTAKSYFSLLALDSEVSLLGKTLQTRDEALRVQQARFKAGASGEYELKLIEAERAAVAASLPKLMAARSQAETALAVLLGRSPREVVEGSIQRGSALDSLAATPDIPAALPTELLSRRPDVQQAAMQFNAADAELSEARRRYFPSISLSGFFGGESLSFGKVLNAPARTWNAAASLSQPLVGLARIDAEVDIARASRKQAEIAYGQAARAAYGDAKTALANHAASQQALQATQSRASSVQRVAELTALRYKAGSASYLDQLNAERDRLSAERDRIDAVRDRLTALVSVYQALGGGWSGTLASKE